MASSQTLLSVERQALDYIQRLEFHKRGRRVFCIHFSSLRPDLQTRSRLNDAFKKLEQLCKRYQGELFQLLNNDMILATKEPDTDVVQEVLRQVCNLFDRDPLIRTARDSFVTAYNLETDYDDLLVYIKVLKHRLEREGAATTNRPEAVDLNDPGMVQTVLGIESPTAFVEKSTIYSVQPARRLEPLLHEMAFRPSALTDLMLDGVIVESNPAIMAPAQRLLERRMLAAISKMTDPWLLPWGLTLGVDALASAEFIHFQRDWFKKWGTADDISPRFFVRLESITSDVERFEFARDFVRSVGFELYLSGVSVSQVRQVDLNKMGLNQVRVDLPQSPDPDEVLDLTKVFETIRNNLSFEGTVFRGCERLDTLRQALDAGAHFVQGKAADAVHAGTESLAA